MTVLETQLEPAWRALIDTLGGTEAPPRAIFTDLCHRYSEPSRFYHTLTHIVQMLHTVDDWEQAVGVGDMGAVRLAVWFHDAVYDSRRGDNEEQSARFAHATLGRLQISGEIGAMTQRLILATKTHTESGGDVRTALFLDADLAILAADAIDYAHYSRAIRQEYAWVSDSDYRIGRSRVLAGFLERPHVYQTPALYDLWEARARENLRAEIETLRA